MTSNSTFRHQPNSGFSLIELLVGVTIGLLGIVVIFQVLSVWDSRKRTTTAGSDAQVAGTIAMFALEREMKAAGYGFGRVTPAELNCDVVALNATGVAANFPLLPMQIVQGAASAPDQLQLLFGSSSYMTGTMSFTSSTPITKRTKYRTGFFPGDLVIVTDGPAVPGTGQCALVENTANSAVDPRVFAHENTTYVKFGSVTPAPSRFNPAAGTGAVFLGGNLYNLGPAPRRTIWQIRTGGVLTVTDSLAATAAADIAEGIVDLQGQYGSLDPVPTNPTIWSDAPPANWATVQAVRVAILARSQQFEKEAVTTAAPRYFAGSQQFQMNNVFGADASDVVGSPTNWRHYRYRVYEKVVPLRNMIWGLQQ